MPASDNQEDEMTSTPSAPAPANAVADGRGGWVVSAEHGPATILGGLIEDAKQDATSADREFVREALALGLDVEPERCDFELLAEDVEKLRRIPTEWRGDAVTRMNEGEPISDSRIKWYIRKSEGAAVAAMLAPLAERTEFWLGCVGPAYTATYRKNGEGLWDQVTGTTPRVVNMEAEHLGFVVGASAIRKALGTLVAETVS